MGSVRPGDWVWVLVDRAYFLGEVGASIDLDAGTARPETLIPVSIIDPFDLPAIKGLAFLADESRKIAAAADASRRLVTVPLSAIQSDDPTNIVWSSGYQDMIEMTKLSIPSIVHNLRKRFFQKHIYTKISSVLISLNPFEKVPLYSSEFYSKYSPDIDDNIETAQPHIFGIARQAVMSLTQNKKDQSILVSGESGAGKTEATKLVLKYLVNVSGTGESIEQKLVDANPILESFGNAKTLRNDNSSRFGRWTSVIFDVRTRKIVGGKVLSYLLEENRLTGQSSGERNFHVLYQACQFSFEEKEVSEHLSGYEIQPEEVVSFKPDLFNYLKNSDEKCDEDDIKGLALTLASLSSIGLNIRARLEIMRLLKAILFVGNIAFNSPKTEGSKLSVEATSLAIASRLLSIDSKAFEEALLHKSLEISGQEKPIKVPLTVEQAIDSRDALARKVYGAIFSWLIQFINNGLKADSPKSEEISALEEKKETLLKPDDFSNLRTIGVLDIFGFESFAKNGLEQFLINFTNEKLQAHFNSIIFKLEEQIYMKEGIDVSEIVFTDNESLLDLLAGKPKGVLYILHDELSIPKSSHLTFTAKLKEVWSGKHPGFVSKEQWKDSFSIVHYAGTVVYSTADFLERSRNKLNKNLFDIFLSSGLKLISSIFAAEIFGETGASSGTSDPADPLVPSLSSAITSRITLSPLIGKRTRGPIASAAALPKVGKEKVPPTSPDRMTITTPASALSGKLKSKVSSIGLEFLSQLTLLMRTISSTETHFVKCIKSNPSKVSEIFDAISVKEQLESSGVLETVKVRKFGFPERFHFADFKLRFGLLQPASVRRVSILSEKIGRKSSAAFTFRESQSGLKLPGTIGRHKRNRSQSKDEYDAKSPIFMENVGSPGIRRKSVRKKSADLGMDFNLKEDCISILLSFQLKHAEIGSKDLWRVGNTMVFLKTGLLTSLERAVREMLGTKLILIQKYTRGFICRRNFAKRLGVFRKLQKLLEDLKSGMPLNDNPRQVLEDALALKIPQRYITEFKALEESLLSKLEKTFQEVLFSRTSRLSERVNLLQEFTKKAQEQKFGKISSFIDKMNEKISKLERVSVDLEKMQPSIKSEIGKEAHLDYLLKEIKSIFPSEFEHCEQIQNLNEMLQVLTSIKKSFEKNSVLLSKIKDPSTKIPEEGKISLFELFSTVSKAYQEAVEVGIVPSRADMVEVASIIQFAQKENDIFKELQSLEIASLSLDQLKQSQKEFVSKYPKTILGLCEKDQAKDYLELFKSKFTSIGSQIAFVEAEMKRVEEERLRKLEEERLKKLEEEKQRKLEEERLKKLEEEKQKKAEIEEKLRKEAEEKAKADAEQLRKAEELKEKALLLKQKAEEQRARAQEASKASDEALDSKLLSVSTDQVLEVKVEELDISAASRGRGLTTSEDPLLTRAVIKKQRKAPKKAAPDKRLPALWSPRSKPVPITVSSPVPGAAPISDSVPSKPDLPSSSEPKVGRKLAASPQKALMSALAEAAMSTALSKPKIISPTEPTAEKIDTKDDASAEKKAITAVASPPLKLEKAASEEKSASTDPHSKVLHSSASADKVGKSFGKVGDSTKSLGGKTSGPVPSTSSTSSVASSSAVSPESPAASASSTVSGKPSSLVFGKSATSLLSESSKEKSEIKEEITSESKSSQVPPLRMEKVSSEEKPVAHHSTKTPHSFASGDKELKPGEKIADSAKSIGSKTSGSGLPVVTFVPLSSSGSQKLISTEPVLKPVPTSPAPAPSPFTGVLSSPTSKSPATESPMTPTQSKVLEKAMSFEKRKSVKADEGKAIASVASSLLPQEEKDSLSPEKRKSIKSEEPKESLVEKRKSLKTEELKTTAPSLGTALEGGDSKAYASLDKKPKTFSAEAPAEDKLTSPTSKKLEKISEGGSKVSSIAAMFASEKPPPEKRKSLKADEAKGVASFGAIFKEDAASSDPDASKRPKLELGKHSSSDSVSSKPSKD